MSGKSRRRGRRLSRSQRKKAGRVVAPPVAATPAAQKPASAPKAAPVAAKAPVVAKAPAPRTAVAEPPNVSGELKRIGVVGGIIVALLVAAYFVLPLVLA
jgi:predicted flap endonuclease-1-like 5' DNA nuclease